MKTNYLATIALMLACFVDISANSSNLFSFNEDAVSSELAELTKLESYVKNNPSSTLSALLSDHNSLVSGLNLSSPYSMSLNFDEPPLGIPSYLWGCCFGVIGVVLVYAVTDGNKDEIKKSVYGWLTTTAVSAVLLVVYYVVLMEYLAVYGTY